MLKDDGRDQLPMANKLDEVGCLPMILLLVRWIMMQHKTPLPGGTYVHTGARK